MHLKKKRPKPKTTFSQLLHKQANSCQLTFTLLSYPFTIFVSKKFKCHFEDSGHLIHLEVGLVSCDVLSVIGNPLNFMYGVHKQLSQFMR